MRLPWLRRPKTRTLRQKDLSPAEEAFLDEEVKRMLDQQAVFINNAKNLVLSSIYTVPKKDGKRRPVINLRWVNKHLRKIKFKMSTIKDVKAAITQGCYMTTMDLKDCFWGLPVHKDDQRFLSFRWKGVNYSFRVLPFGLATSPLFITKLYRNVVEHLQIMGHRVIIYIDDLLILGDTKEQCIRSTQAVSDLLKSLGAVINEPKSSLVPEQVKEYLGFVLNSKDMEIRAPINKLKNCSKELRKMLNKEQVSPRQLASILGKINSLADALFPTRVHTNDLHRLKLSLLQGKNWDRVGPLSPEARQDLLWWKENIFRMNGRSLTPPTVDINCATDSSGWAWGAWMETPEGLVRWRGVFPCHLADKHINYKELKAVHYLLRSATPAFTGKTLGLGIDNTTALWYLRKMGGKVPELAKLTQAIFEILDKNSIQLAPYHLPGKDNTMADAESRIREVNQVDLALNHAVFRLIDRLYGPFTIDLFATHQDKQIERFASWMPQPDAVWLNAMVHPWTKELGWAHPPFSMIGRVLEKVEKEKSTITILAPLWPAQPWFPALLRLMTEPPLILPSRSDLFVHPLLREGRNPSWVSLAWKISGNHSFREASLRKLSPRFSRPGSQALTKIMNRIGLGGPRSLKAEARIRALKISICSLHGWQD